MLPELATTRPPALTQGAGSNDTKAGAGRQALGRSRGGLSTKIHLVADRRCRPIARLTSPGQHGDSPRFVPLLQQIRIRRRGLGRSRVRPARVMADKAYSSKANRAYLRERGIKAVIPVKEDQKPTAASAARPVAGHRPSTPSATRTATPSSVPSTSSKRFGRLPPDTTSSTSSTRAPSTSPRSRSGSATPSFDPRNTP
ncbi:transposase [Amycolatopsis australiensis]|uniref:transposase n=1 Tax=Amycolatopsis australiensis TaxID=546364 RepID=UPI003CCBB8C8